MFSLALTRWFMGYVRFAVCGGSLERFLNQCARSGIYLWDIQTGQNRAASVAARRYRALRRCARKAGCRLKIIRRSGFPFATFRIRKRKGLMAGSILFLVIVMVLSNRMWSFEVVGNTSIPATAITAELAALGIGPGTPKKYLQPQLLQQALMLKFPQISWISVNTHGCKAEIRLQEKTEKPPIAVKDVRPCDIKAAATGQIVSLEVYAGTPQVKEGDAVVEGQLLISGEVKDEAGETSLKHAAGKIMAETTRTVSVEIPLKRTVVQDTGSVVTRRCLHFMGARIPLTMTVKPDGNYRQETYFTKIRLMNTSLPIGVYEEDWIEQTSAAVTLTREQALLEAKQEIQEKIKNELKDVQTLSSSASDKMTSSSLIYTAVLKCRENIGREAEILIN